jgi:hypothetical protein
LLEEGNLEGSLVLGPYVIDEIEAVARSTDLGIRQIQQMLGGRASRGIVGEITKRARSAAPPALCSLSRSKPQGR